MSRTWLLTAELYLRLGEVEAAEQCANEARQLYPLSYHILYLRGAIHQVTHLDSAVPEEMCKAAMLQLFL